MYSEDSVPCHITKPMYGSCISKRISLTHSPCLHRKVTGNKIQYESLGQQRSNLLVRRFQTAAERSKQVYSWRSCLNLTLRTLSRNFLCSRVSIVTDTMATSLEFLSLAAVLYLYGYSWHCYKFFTFYLMIASVFSTLYYAFTSGTPPLFKILDGEVSDSAVKD
jgi:hypothetical protein